MLDRLTKLREERANSDEGFTLIELLVVVVIIGILIAIAIPLYLNYTKGASDKSAQSDLRGAVSSLEQCNSDNSVYPASLTLNTAKTAYTTDSTCANGTLNVSKGDSLTYFNVTATGAAGPTGYIIESKNTSGSGTVYCYSSTAGGSVSKASSNTVISAYQAAC